MPRPTPSVGLLDALLEPTANGQSVLPSGTTDPVETPSPMSPGDDAPPGTPGTGENLCPRCGGSGRDGATDCPECDGTGKVTTGIGGA